MLDALVIGFFSRRKKSENLEVSLVVVSCLMVVYFLWDYSLVYTGYVFVRLRTIYNFIFCKPALF